MCATAIPVGLDVQANHPPTADGQSVSVEEDSSVMVLLAGTDAEDQGPSTFRIGQLPAHGILTDWLGERVIAGALLTADYFDADSGRWTLPLYFAPEENWSGSSFIAYVAVDSEGAESTTATAMIEVLPRSDAPIVDANVNDGADPLGTALNLSLSNGGEDGPVVAALDHGRTLVVWQQGLFPSRIVGRIFAADGSPEGAAFNISPVGGPNEFGPAVATKPDGSFAVAWMQDGAGTGGADIVTAFFAAGTTAPASVLTTIGGSNGIERAPSIAASADGWVVSGAFDSGSGVPGIRVQPFAADLTPAMPFTVLTGVAEARPVPIGSGNAFIVVGAADDGILMQAIVAGGVAAAPDPVDVSGRADAAVAAALADGGWVIVWVDDDGAGNQDLHARVYDAGGTARGAAMALTDTPYASEFAPEVAALPDGRFVVAWIGNNGADGSQDVFSQVFAADGAPAGDPIEVTRTGTGALPPYLPIEEIQPTITVGSDGRYTVGWLQIRATGGNNADIFVRSYAPSPKAVAGDAGVPLMLPTTIRLADRDGSESLSNVTIQGLPEGFTMAAGHRIGGGPGGDWIIDRDDPADGAFLDALDAGTAALIVTAPIGFEGTPVLTIFAVAGDAGDPLRAVSAPASVPLAIRAVLIMDLNGAGLGLGNDVAYVEGDGAMRIAPAAIFAGGSDADVAGGTLVLRFAANADDDDLLAVLWDGPGPGQIDRIGDLVRFGGSALGHLVVGADGSLTLALDAAATMAGVEAFLRHVTFANSSEAPTSAARSLSVSLVDAAGRALSTATIGIGVTGIDDPAIARDDLLAAIETGAVTGDLFADHGAGADPDVDGPALRIAAVNGSAVFVGQTVVLASGARLLVHADGSYVYDPNGAFDWLVSGAKAAQTGAVNMSAKDGFTYTLAGGGSATVEVIVSGADGTGDQLWGDGGNNAMDGSAGADLFVLSDGGADDARGDAGNDRFYFGAALDPQDRIDGGDGDDSVILGGRTTIAFGETMLTGIERLRLLAVGGGAGEAYRLTMADGNVVAGRQLRVDALDLGAGEGLTFLGMAETDGRFLLLGGRGGDILVGGARNDQIQGGGGDDQLYGSPGDDRLEGALGGDRLNGGSGFDRFVYASAAESSGVHHDLIDRFEPLRDKIDLPVGVSGWSGRVSAGALSESTFDRDLAAAVDTSLQAHSALLFTPDAGDFAGCTILVVDGDGDGVYQFEHDYVIALSQTVGILSAGADIFV